jgi:RNA recognition motif-containing protein
MYLYVVNLPDQPPLTFLKDTLRILFSAYGLVSEVYVNQERTNGRVSTYAFVEMPLPMQAQMARWALSGSELGGQQIVIMEAAAAPVANGSAAKHWKPLSQF